MLETLEPALLSESKWAAKKKCREYQSAYDAGHKEYGELLTVYKQLARGSKVISVNKSMESMGVHPNGHPVLAIANADSRWCWFVRQAGLISDPDGQWDHPASAFISDFSINPGWVKSPFRRATKKTVFRFLRQHFPIRCDYIQARVPTVPGRVLPRGNLKNYIIMWEANWETSPVDPILLRRITREFFVVICEWHLTRTECLVLEMAAYSGE